MKKTSEYLLEEIEKVKNVLVQRLDYQENENINHFNVLPDNHIQALDWFYNRLHLMELDTKKQLCKDKT